MHCRESHNNSDDVESFLLRIGKLRWELFTSTTSSFVVHV